MIFIQFFILIGQIQHTCQFVESISFPVFFFVNLTHLSLFHNYTCLWPVKSFFPLFCKSDTPVTLSVQALFMIELSDAELLL